MSSERHPVVVACGKRSREEKQRRWRAKQEAKRNVQEKQHERLAWFRDNAHFATLLSKKDVDAFRSIDVAAKKQDESSSRIASLLHPYWNLQDGTKKQHDNRDDDDDGRLFIAEGTETVRLLVQQSLTSSSAVGLNYGTIQIKSIFTKLSVLFEPPVHLLEDVELSSRCLGASSEATGKGKDNRTTVNEPELDYDANKKSSATPFHVLVGDSEKTLSLVAGFETSRGAMACGVIPQHHTQAWLLQNYLPAVYQQKNERSLRLLALDGVSDTANLGSMIRCASAFGVDAILLSHECCDAWYRRAVRVSMGHIFRVPCVRVANLEQVLAELAATGIAVRKDCPTSAARSECRRQVITSYAAIVDADTDFVLERVERGSVPKSWCCVMGNESTGISPAVVKKCTKTIRIDMSGDVDSLSVPIATGILLHGLREREKVLNRH